MSGVLTCTWAPTPIAGPRMLKGQEARRELAGISGQPLRDRRLAPVVEA